MEERRAIEKKWGIRIKYKKAQDLLALWGLGKA